MAGNIYTAVHLLLLSLIRTGVNGEYIFAKRGYDITFPCAKDFVCFHVWPFSTRKASDYITIVTNGEIQTSRLEDDNSKCTLQIKDLTVKDVGHHHCQQRPNVSSRQMIASAAPELNLMPGETVSLQCILFTYLEQRHCYTGLQKKISLTWVDETGAKIQEDSQYQIKQQSSCDITLIVTLQSPQNKKFRCRMTVDKKVQTSVEVGIRVPALKGRGRDFIVEPEPEPQDHNKDTIGAAVGVVGCVMLTVLVMAFVVHRRKARIQLPNEPSNTISITNVVNADDVIYADIFLPVGSDRLWVQECDSTEYACVIYK